MTTKLLYMEYFGTGAATATVEKVEATEDGRTQVSLDQTEFYPRGGGQDWDTGRIVSEHGELLVEEVRLSEDGIVWHIGTQSGEPFQAGESVTCHIDTERRTINTRLHSAGHLVDLATDRLKLPWIPGRGAHYPHMSFVEYAGEWDAEQGERIKQEMQAVIDDVITTGGENEIRFMPVEEMSAICRHVPDNIPKNKPARVVVYCGNFGVPCGGTHVQNLKDISKVTVTKIKKKDGVIRVSYAVEGIN